MGHGPWDVENGFPRIASIRCVIPLERPEARSASAAAGPERAPAPRPRETGALARRSRRSVPSQGARMRHSFSRTWATAPCTSARCGGSVPSAARRGARRSTPAGSAPRAPSAAMRRLGLPPRDTLLPATEWIGGRRAECPAAAEVVYVHLNVHPRVSKRKKLGTEITVPSCYFMVAGAGFEPTTFGL